MRICFDLDNTLCVGKPYETAKPLPGAKEMLDELSKQGHTVIIHTARGMGSSNGDQGQALKNIGLITFKQLEQWGFKYDEVYFGKPAADMYIDDKSLPVLPYKEILTRIQKWDKSGVEETLGKLNSLIGG